MSMLRSIGSFAKEQDDGDDDDNGVLDCSFEPRFCDKASEDMEQDAEADVDVEREGEGEEEEEEEDLNRSCVRCCCCCCCCCCSSDDCIGSFRRSRGSELWWFKKGAVVAATDSELSLQPFLTAAAAAVEADLVSFLVV